MIWDIIKTLFVFAMFAPVVIVLLFWFTLLIIAFFKLWWIFTIKIVGKWLGITKVLDFITKDDSFDGDKHFNLP